MPTFLQQLTLNPINQVVFAWAVVAIILVIAGVFVWWLIKIRKIRRNIPTPEEMKDGHYFHRDETIERLKEIEKEVQDDRDERKSDYAAKKERVTLDRAQKRKREAQARDSIDSNGKSAALLEGSPQRRESIQDDVVRKSTGVKKRIELHKPSDF